MSFADFYRDEDEEETFGNKRTGGGNPARGGRGGRRGAANKLTIKSGREIGGEDNDFGNYGSTTITKESDKIGEEIIQALSKINEQNNKIEKIVDKLGTPKDTHELREQLGRELETTAKYAKQTGSLMTNLQKIVQQDASDNSAKLLLNKLKKEVSDSVSRFDKVAKLSAKKEKEFVVKQKKEQQQLQKKLGSNGGVYDSSADEYSEQDELLQAQQQLQAQKQREKELLMNQIEHNESLIAEREDDIKKIETEVVEISNIMRELNYLVNEQGEQIIVIDDLVTETQQHVKAGNKDLGQAENLDKKSRNLFCILLIIVLGIGIAAAIVLVVILKLTLRF